MTELEEEIAKALPMCKSHKIASYKKRLEWVNITITILTPSLVLLVGLQGKPQPSEWLSTYLLLSSILLMTLTILMGLLILLGESEAHLQAVGEIKEWVDSGRKIAKLPFSITFPWYQDIFYKIFPIFVWLSILSLGAFGFLKYI